MSEEIRRAIEEMGYESPMPVQEEVIPYLLGVGNDVIALAQTGAGKTAAFGLPVLQKIRTDDKRTQAVILSPTRELCLQIAGDLKDYSRYIDHLHVVAVYGGSSIESQIRNLKKGAQVIVATPGRLIDLMHRGVARLDAVENVVLDEADEMLNMGISDIHSGSSLNMFNSHWLPHSLVCQGCKGTSGFRLWYNIHNRITILNSRSSF